MTLTINGNAMDVPETVSSVSDLITHLELGSKRLVVEVNQEIIDKSMHAEQQLTNGDRVEIVHFVGGG
ncbi:sulfur carrier protein ThiS [Aquibacillus albus]|uniref:Sulfur carrier protein n=1 Tax=Aquibacillus albus TaxID=1168171 RepID=A0ABS2N643_9BACI|nr:sulfur carrier protein ThiS [Aquibacillus albus]MBM7573597.1 sulfur carrier protein [Aquibacillus albus]